MQRDLSYWLGRIIWVPILFFSTLLIVNALPYFSFADGFKFLSEKGEIIHQPVWRVSFYLHIATSMLCLIVAFPLFSASMLRKNPKWHRLFGKIYISAVILIAAPSGLYMSAYAKGGFWGFLGFFVIGVWWFYSTYKGYTLIRQGKVKAHSDWMIRSYAVALSALTFRIYQIMFHYMGLDETNSYIASLWVSNIGNVYLGELAIYFKNRPSTFITKISKS